jgi:hypothetical protein
MQSWYSIIYSSLIFSSIVLFIISFFTTGSSTIGSAIAGYSTLASGVLMIVGFLLSNISKIAEASHMTTYEYFSLIFTNVSPFLIILGVISYSLYLLINYQNRISLNQIPSSYHTFSTISIILTLLQIFLFYKAMNSKIFQNTGQISKIIGSFISLVSVINIVNVLILGTILKYFTTDG